MLRASFKEQRLVKVTVGKSQRTLRRAISHSQLELVRISSLNAVGIIQEAKAGEYHGR